MNCKIGLGLKLGFATYQIKFTLLAPGMRTTYAAIKPNINNFIIKKNSIIEIVIFFYIKYCIHNILFNNIKIFGMINKKKYTKFINL